MFQINSIAFAIISFSNYELHKFHESKLRTQNSELIIYRLSFTIFLSTDDTDFHRLYCFRNSFFLKLRITQITRIKTQNQFELRIMNYELQFIIYHLSFTIYHLPLSIINYQLSTVNYQLSLHSFGLPLGSAALPAKNFSQAQDRWFLASWGGLGQ